MSQLTARLLYSAIALAILFAICPVEKAGAGPPQQQGTGMLTCTVSILPQKYFVERIAGEHVVVDVMVGSGQSPATYEPTGRQLSALSDSRLYFSIGVAFEQTLLPRIKRSFEGVDVIDSSAGIERRRMAEHTHHGDGEDSNRDLGVDDPHVWLAPDNAIRIAENIRFALCRHDPARTSIYNRNFEALKLELHQTDILVAEILSTHSGQEIFVFHPAYGYFTDEYGLIQVPIEVAGGTPGPRHLAGIIDHAKAESVSTIFVQPQFSPSSAQTIARTVGAEIHTLDPLAENYSENLVIMARKIAAALPTRTAKE